jgi:ABC-type spermidine/putrescine transport system permease subunit II
MKNRPDFIETTVIGGIVFLIPVVVVVIARRCVRFAASVRDRSTSLAKIRR